MKSLLKASFTIAALAFMLGAVNVLSARADTVTYSTQGSFAGNAFATNNSVALGGGLTLNFTGLTNFSVNAPSNISLGQFEITGVGTSPNIVNLDFDLRIIQTVPNNGQADIDADISGTVTSGPPGSSTLFVTFNSPSVTINGVTYTLEDTTIAVPPPGRASTIEATVSNPIPEPTTMLLLGTGLAGIAARARKRRNAA